MGRSRPPCAWGFSTPQGKPLDRTIRAFLTLLPRFKPVSAIVSATIRPSSSNKTSRFSSSARDMHQQGFLPLTSYKGDTVARRGLQRPENKLLHHGHQIQCNLLTRNRWNRHLRVQLTNVFRRFEGPQAAERPLLGDCCMPLFSNKNHWLL